MSDNPNVVTVNGGIVSNAAAIAVQSVIAPLSVSSVVNAISARTLDHAAGTRPPTKPNTRTAKTITVNPRFKLVFLTVVAITIAAGVAHIIMASIWTDPTPNQQTAFNDVANAWKTGLGAILGLLGGKVT